jgi:DNA-binding IclR family transcriptional regulator
VGPASNARAQAPASRGPNYPIESVDNALRLLMMVAERKQVRVSEASAELGTAVSTAHRLLAMLAHHDLVAQDAESKAYRAGPALVRMGLAAVRNLDIRVLARPYIESLRDSARETVHLAVLQGREVLFVDCAESPQALRVASRTGTVMPAHCTSVGKALLATLPEASLRSTYRTARLSALTPFSVTQRSELFSQLEEVRKVGYAHNNNEGELGVGSVSAAVLDGQGRGIAGISVAVPLVRMSDKRWAQLAAEVTGAARMVEAVLP